MAEVAGEVVERKQEVAREVEAMLAVVEKEVEDERADVRGGRG